jgi:hypothetical protein
MKLKTLLPLALIASPVFADDFRSFSDLSITGDDFGDADMISLNSQYYFADQSTNGPLDETGYLDTDSNLSVHLINTDFLDIYGIEGEAFLGNFLLGGGYTHSKADILGSSISIDVLTLKAGYMFNDNLIISLEVAEPDEGDTGFQAQVEYDHSLNSAGDYIGTTLTYADDGDDDAITLSSSYFGKMGSGQWLRAGIDIQSTDADDIFGVNAAFYFNERASVSAKIDNNDTYGIGAKYYFTSNFAATFEYTDNDGLDTFTTGVVAQF